MFWKLKRKLLIWLSIIFRNWSDSINNYLWQENAFVSFKAAEQPRALDAANSAAKEQAWRNDFLRSHFGSNKPPRQ